MDALRRLALTVAILIGLGLFVALLSAKVSVEGIHEPGVTGKFAVQFALGFALIIGWAFGAAVEQLWKGKSDEPRQPVSHIFLVIFEAAYPRIFCGTFLFFIVIAAEFAFEALGVGLGAR